MIIDSRLRRVTLLLTVAAMTSLVAGCATEYHGYDSGIDGVLWRQVASFKGDLEKTTYGPLDETIGRLHAIDSDSYPAPVSSPSDYLAGIEAPRWDGTAGSSQDLDLEKGGAILFGESFTASIAQFSVFIASGPRPNSPTDEGGLYIGPIEVYTCYAFEVTFVSEILRPIDRTELTECPPELVQLLPDDAAFASAEVFNG